MNNPAVRRLAAAAAVTLRLGAHDAHGQEATARTDRPLKAIFEDDFLVGASLSLHDAYGRDTSDRALIQHRFNTISPENRLKGDSVEPGQGNFAFEAADRFVAYGERHGMFIVEHTLVWHSQTPR